MKLLFTITKSSVLFFRNAKDYYDSNAFDLKNPAVIDCLTIL